MTKRIISFLTSLLMVISLVSVVPVITASAATSGDYEYSVSRDGTIQITGYNGSEENLIIPSTIDGKKVTSIGNAIGDLLDGNGPFSGKSFKSVTIPDTVTDVNPNAFSNCENLSYIIIPKSVKNIRINAFNGCKKMQNIYFVGSEEEWNNTTRGLLGQIFGSSDLDNVTMHYNYDPDSQPKIKYQLARNIPGMIRFVLLIDEEKARNTQVANLSLNGNGIKEVNVPITTAYRKIKADGNIISAGEVKVFLIVVFRNFPIENLTGLNVKINLDDEIYERTI